ALGRSYGFARRADRNRAKIAPGCRCLVVAARRAAAAAAATTAAAARRKPRAVRRCCRALVVEDIKSREADVRDFLLGEADFVRAAGVSRERIGGLPSERRCGRRARQRQRQPGGAQPRERFALAFRERVLSLQHVGLLWLT